MPSADEKETAATATAKHITDHCPIRFLPVTTLIAHCDEMREDQTNISDLANMTAIPMTVPPLTAMPIALPHQNDGGSSKKKSKREDKKKKKEGKKEPIEPKEQLVTCDESEKKTVEEM
ncbi:hypothetical protein PENTCL1PPCAC_11351 [Pristionchus entomophagus]|uniref:Uncharacterized protein n=1 Tax=Pristionchus entomophagus TaxID=358040 RepID=A0AAV5T113_9BILA|nr:hypothetical protein PENTCL1PPCAC_11351 [Pristionchus entomophagus]